MRSQAGQKVDQFKNSSSSRRVIFEASIASWSRSAEDGEGGGGRRQKEGKNQRGSNPQREEAEERDERIGEGGKRPGGKREAVEGSRRLRGRGGQI